jgi:hypothetical protein
VAKRNNLVTMQEARELTKEDRVRIFFNDLQKLDELLEVVHRKALDGDPAAVHAEVKVLERRSHMFSLDAPRQLDMTLEVRTQRSTGDVLRASIERMVAQGKLSPETQERIRPFGFLPKADARSAEDAQNPFQH